MLSRPPLLLRLSALAALTAVGCGDSRTASVSGHVTLNGSPLPNATVFFQPEGTAGDPNPGQGSLGETDAGGAFTLRFVGGGRGVVVGKQKVTISAFEGPAPDPKDDNARPRKNRVPARYNSASQLTFEVPPGGTSAANFELTSP